MKMPGAPPSRLVHTPAAEVTSELPWGLQKAMPPTSDMARMAGMDTPASSGTGATRVPIGIDKAYAEFRKLGVSDTFGLALPIGPAGVYVANVRKMKVRGDVRFSDWYAGGKAIEWSTNVHMGREFRPWNRWLMLLACVATTVMSVAAITMWWKRRPSGRLGLPPYPVDPHVLRGFIVIMGVAGVIFPLVGASLLVAAAIDRTIAQLTRPPNGSKATG